MGLYLSSLGSVTAPEVPKASEIHDSKGEKPSIMLELWKELDCPVLDIGDRRGSTDYIDFISEDELTHPIMKGIDTLNRPFFCLRFTVKTDKETRTAYRTFFQRYTSNKHTWCSADVRGLNYNRDTFYCGLRRSTYDMIATLLRTGIYKYDHLDDGVTDAVPVGAVLQLATAL